MNVPSDELQRANRRAAWAWGSGVVAFLALQLVLGFSAIALSQADPSVALVPDYYQKALDWDETKRIRTASAELGWNVTAVQDGREGLVITVRNAEGRPVEIDRGTVAFFRHARASILYTRDVGPCVDGEIRVSDSFDHPGLWTLNVDIVDRDGTRFVDGRELPINGKGTRP